MDKKTDHTLQFWPKQSSEINLTQSTKPEDIKRKWKNKIKIPPKTKIDYLKQRGIIESAITNHAAGFYQNRDNENFAFIIITYNGTANIEYNGKLHKLKTNSIMIAPQGSSFVIKNKGKWNFLWLHLKSKFWEAYLGKELRIIENSEIVNDIKLDDNILIATKSWQYKEKLPRQNPKNWILFGKCADFASSNPAV